MKQKLEHEIGKLLTMLKVCLLQFTFSDRLNGKLKWIPALLRDCNFLSFNLKFYSPKKEKIFTVYDSIAIIAVVLDIRKNHYRVIVFSKGINLSSLIDRKYDINVERRCHCKIAVSLSFNKVQYQKY